MTINPLPHIEREQVGMVLVPLITVFMYSGQWLIGWASAPYNFYWAIQYPRRAALMAVAGPLSNLILALAAGVGLRIGVEYGFFNLPVRFEGYAQIVEAAQPGVAVGAAKLLSILFSMNLLLFVFNLIPLPPLDGSAVIPLLLSHEGGVRYRHFAAQPAFSMLGMIVAWKLVERLFPPVFLRGVTFIYSGM